MKILIILFLTLAVLPLYEPRGEIYEGMTFQWNNYQVKVRRIEGDACEVVSTHPKNKTTEGHWLMRDEVISLKNGGYSYNTEIRTVRKCPHCDGQFEVFKEYHRPCPNCGKGEL